MSGPTFCILNGAVVPPAEASVSVMDRGFLYGDGAFEVLRSYGGTPLCLEAHLSRLERGCARLGLAAPVEWLRGELSRAAVAVEGDASLRAIVTRGSSGRGIHDTRGHPTRVVLAQPLSPSLGALREEGVEAITVSFGGALDGTPAAGVKAANYLPNVLALQEASRRGAHEALLVGPGGEVREGATSTLFVVSGGRVLTPPLSLGILAGITRELLLGALEQVEERPIFPRDLYAAEEAWIASSLRELVPLRRVDGVDIGGGEVGPRFLRAYAAFRARVDALMVDALMVDADSAPG